MSWHLPILSCLSCCPDRSVFSRIGTQPCRMRFEPSFLNGTSSSASTMHRSIRNRFFWNPSRCHVWRGGSLRDMVLPRYDPVESRDRLGRGCRIVARGRVSDTLTVLRRRVLARWCGEYGRAGTFPGLLVWVICLRCLVRAHSEVGTIS